MSGVFCDGTAREVLWGKKGADRRNTPRVEGNIGNKYSLSRSLTPLLGPSASPRAVRCLRASAVGPSRERPTGLDSAASLLLADQTIARRSREARLPSSGPHRLQARMPRSRTCTCWWSESSFCRRRVHEELAWSLSSQLFRVRWVRQIIWF